MFELATSLAANDTIHNHSIALETAVTVNLQTMNRKYLRVVDVNFIWNH